MNIVDVDPGALMNIVGPSISMIKRKGNLKSYFCPTLFEWSGRADPYRMACICTTFRRVKELNYAQAAYYLQGSPTKFRAAMEILGSYQSQTAFSVVDTERRALL